MLPRHQDPIMAIATAPGRGAVGIVRLSGANLQPLVLRLFGHALVPRQAHYLPFFDASGQAIDQGLALYFPAPHSFTGEDVLELHAHGGTVVLQLLLANCLALAAQVDATNGAPTLARLRMAQPGEFSERAFLNGKIDLAQAEAIADLIDASTEAAARSATQSLRGAFSQAIHTLRAALIRLRTLVEATLDFPEEEIDFLQRADAQGQLDRLQSELATVLAQAKQGALLREGIRVVIAGQPNVGKSSLLNALAGAELAIVTPIAGTTRDRVQETIQIEGIPLHIIDTAGLRESEDTVEKIGIERAWQAIHEADAVLFLHDVTRSHEASYRAHDQAIAEQLALHLNQPSNKHVVLLHVWNKVDLASDQPSADSHSGDKSLALSAKTGQGLDALRQALLQTAGWAAPASGGVFIARQRHLEAMRQVQHHLGEAALHLRARAQSLDLLAEELRLAQNALNDITGAFSSDDLLGVIFSKFCIGK